MNIDLRIDELILEGFSLSPRERAILRAAVESELTRLLGAGGLGPMLTRGGAAPVLHASNIQLTPGMAPTQLGTQIAQSVYGGIGKHP